MADQPGPLRERTFCSRCGRRWNPIRYLTCDDCRHRSRTAGTEQRRSAANHGAAPTPQRNPHVQDVLQLEDRVPAPVHPQVIIPFSITSLLDTY
jgi:uncharacterized protein YlaI